MKTRAGKRKRAVSFLAGMLVAAGVSFPTPAADIAESPWQLNWPAWRGPLACGVAPTGNPPLKWSESSNVKWKVKIPGNGSATPVIWDDRVFVQTAIPTGRKVKPDATSVSAMSIPHGEAPDEVLQFAVLCLDRATGKILWQKILREELPHEGILPGEGSYASSSPVTDGRHLFAYFGSRGLHCLDWDGNIKWEQDLGKLRIKKEFGEGSSPALFNGRLIVLCDQETNSFITAFDTETGKQLWRQPRDEATAWATPVVAQYGGGAQVITDASSKIRSYDLDTGKMIWEGPALTPNAIPSPVVGDGVVYCMSGFKGNACYAIKLGRTGDLKDSDAILWSLKKGTPYVPSPLLYGDHLFFLSNNSGLLSCVDVKTGRLLMNMERIEDLKTLYASPVGAAGRVYLVSRSGVTVVVKNSEQLQILATNKLDDGFDASPAIVGHEIFLRGHEYLYCLAESAPADAK